MFVGELSSDMSANKICVGETVLSVNCFGPSMIPLDWENTSEAFESQRQKTTIGHLRPANI